MNGEPLNSWWGYDFDCGQSIDAILDAFNAAGPWQWQRGDSDIYGDYVRCRPTERSRVRVYECSQLRRSQREDPGGFYAELVSDPEGRSEIDEIFRRLLKSIDATDIVDT
jgi:hypothetical protein